MEKKNRKKIRLLVELESTPFIEQACKKVGIVRSTFYRWCADDRAFFHRSETAREKGREKLNDYVESKLLENISNGHQAAIQYWLTNNSKTYGAQKLSYMERYKQEEKLRLIRNKEIVEYLDMEEAITMLGGDPEIIKHALQQAIRMDYKSLIINDEEIDV
jgi:hypothetical protein